MSSLLAHFRAAVFGCWCVEQGNEALVLLDASGSFCSVKQRSPLEPQTLSVERAMEADV